MKKVLALVLVLALALSFTACGGSAKVKTGLAIVSSTSATSATADEDGKAQVDSTVAAVLVDESGKIVACKLDVAQNKIPVAADGTFPTDLTFKSKQELKDDYNMRGASPIGKEWNEQADAFAAYVVGKTADEVAAIAVVGEHSAPDVADLAASCTMNVVDMQAAIVEACKNAQDLGATATDTLGLGVSTEMSHYCAQPADNEGEGAAQADTTYAAVSYGKDGKITSVRVNATQAKFSTAEDGTVAVVGDGITPKMEQGEAYSMRAASPIGKEWNEQAAAFETYAVGKTAAEIAGMALDTANHNGPVDIAASCTMDVRAFMDAIGRAMA